MWHEARKQEKMIRGMIVDYRRRAERRKDFYEKIKADPTQFLQIHGRPCKIHLDPAVAAAGEGPAIMMQWQGDPSNMIDRFDVRAHLDYIPELEIPEVPPEDLDTEERHCNYERYRIIAQNAFLGMGEDKFLQQLAIEEQFGTTLEEKEVQREKLNEKKGTGAAIGYNYNDPGAQPSSSNGLEAKKTDQKDKDSDEDSDLEILDVDLSIDVNKMEPSQAHELNAVGPFFGMAGCDLFSFLTGDADDAEHQKQLLIEEKEKAMYSGRKSRRERRAHRDKKLATRVMSPPSYAAPSQNPEKSESRSPSRSPSPEAADQIEFITSFGGDEEEAKPPSAKTLYSDKVKQNLKKLELYSEVARKHKPRSPMSEESYPCPIGPRGPNSRSRSKSKSRSLSKLRSLSRSRSRSRKSRSRSRKSRSKSRSRSRSRSRARKSRSRSRYTSRSRSSRSHSRSSSYRRSRTRSRSRNYRSRRSRSPNYSKRKKSRSMSCDSSDRGGSSKANVPRYYGRKKEDKSSSELSVDSGSSDSEVMKNKLAVGNKSNANQNVRSSGSSSKGTSRDALSLKEKLKKKMQAQLSRQLRADKRARAEREERESRRQARRDEEMRELAIKLRRKQREMRHRNTRSSDESDRSRSKSSSRDSTGEKKPSRSKSRSPPEKRPQVWENNSAPYKTDEPPLPPLPPLHTLPPPPVRKRIPEQEFVSKPYYDKRDRSRSPPIRRIPVWEAQRDSFRPEVTPYPDSRRPRYQEEDRPDYRYDNPRRYDHRFEQNPHDNRWDSSRRRPYGNRGGYRGYCRPPLPPGTSPNWQREQDYDDDYDRNKVKLVDY